MFQKLYLIYFILALRLLMREKTIILFSLLHINAWNFQPAVLSVYSYSSLESNRSLSRFFLLPQFLFFQGLRTRLLRHGKSERSLVVFTNFLMFLKSSYDVDPVWFLKATFLTNYLLPFRLYTIKLSNRNYNFPGPILNDAEYQSLLIKAFGRSLKKREHGSFLNNFFQELCLFFDLQPDSLLLQALEKIIQQGFENRAYVHYRWLSKR